MILHWELNNTVDCILAVSPGKASWDSLGVGDTFLAHIVFVEFDLKALTAILSTLVWSGVHLYASESARHHCHYSAAMSMTPTGIDQLVTLMTNMGFDASDMSLTEAQHMVATARAATQGSLPASSSQGPQPTTIATLPDVPISRVMDQDEIPLTLLQQPNVSEESTDTARILAAASS
eukprot:5567730-Amphidinium_carterae.1